MTKRPKLLFLAYNFPPVRACASVRAKNISTSLAGLGWDVTVVTPRAHFHPATDDPAQVKVDLANAGVEQILTGHHLRMLLERSTDGLFSRLKTKVARNVAWRLGIEWSVGWNRSAVKACSTLEPDDVDMILATGPPFVAFRTAARLAAKWNRPFALDYRDAWTNTPFAQRKICSARTIREEEQLLREAAIVIANSPQSSAELDRRFHVGDKLHTITNGFDPSELDAVTPASFDHFAIVYAGAFYQPKRVVTPVMKSLQKLETMGDPLPPWKFHYYGPHQLHVREQAKRCGVLQRVVLHGNVSRQQALATVRGADLTVVIHSSADVGDQAELGVIPGKLFDALGLATPILLIAPNGCDAREVLRDHPESACVTGRETQRMTDYIRQRMRSGKPNLKSAVTPSYAWPRLGQKLDRILRKAVDCTPECMPPHVRNKASVAL